MRWCSPHTSGPRRTRVGRRLVECLEPVDLAFRLTIAPGGQDGVLHRIDVLSQCSRETPHGMDSAPRYVRQPRGRTTPTVPRRATDTGTAPCQAGRDQSL